MSILVSTFHLMGTILYFATEIYCGFKHVILVSKTLHSTSKICLMKRDKPIRIPEVSTGSKKDWKAVILIRGVITKFTKDQNIKSSY